MKRIIFLLIAGFILISAVGGQTMAGINPIMINEVLSSNTKWNHDNDFGAFADWIELYNSADSNINIEGWHC